ncbi:competence type IV pilus minor pilin ComGF [Bacillus marasmi]|uniref:competence type IV pilus minor pilin ComGF n=1 Tax=Bacillus marasmi TaxID=1926279 RepID=UPI0011C7AA3A|nr:competence type IV pilus minor pilin ComGF [Bacillus marasmi]
MKIKTPLFFKNVAVRNNNKGFTLVEMLVAFSIFSIIIGLLPMLISTLSREQPLERRVQRLEWEVFISQIKKEIRMSQKVTINNQSLLLEKDGSIIIYEKYGTNLRRRVDYKGHEIILQQVRAFQFQRLLNGVLVQVTDTYGHDYREEIRLILRDVVF